MQRSAPKVHLARDAEGRRGAGISGPCRIALWPATAGPKHFMVVSADKSLAADYEGTQAQREQVTLARQLRKRRGQETGQSTFWHRA